jgi:putative PIN family toxin of toxin-antitoxin system
MQPIVVFDTNILMSGTGWRGNPYRCLELARAERVQGLTCREILDELTEKLRVKLYFSDERIADTLVDLLSFLRPMEIFNTLKNVTLDPDDNMIVECALVGHATHIVTGDRRHLLPLGSYQGVAIVSAADFLKQFSAT